MPDNIIAEMRQLLQEMIVPDLKALTYKVDGLQKQIELTERSMATRFNAFRDELAEFRAELTTFRTEMGDFRAEMRIELQSQTQSTLEGSPARNLTH